MQKSITVLFGALTGFFVSLTLRSLLSIPDCPPILFNVTKSEQEKRFSNDKGITSKSIRILCYLNTYPKTYDTKALHVHYSWARRCTDHLFTSTKLHPVIPVMRLNLSFPETKNHLWIKMKIILRELYKEADQYDYFFKGDDDTYVIMENLRELLAQYDPDKSFMTGIRVPNEILNGFFSGGAGYVLSRAALKDIVERALDKHPLCPNKDEAKEDVKMSICGRLVGVKTIDSRGENNVSLFYTKTFEQFLADYKRAKMVCISTGICRRLIGVNTFDSCAENVVTLFYPYIIQTFFANEKYDKLVNLSSS